MPNSVKILMLSLCAPLAFSKILVVGAIGVPCPNPGYNTIQSAVTAANPGDTIHICPALYPEPVLITKPLMLVGIEQQGVVSEKSIVLSWAVLTNVVRVVRPIGSVSVFGLSINSPLDSPPAVPTVLERVEVQPETFPMTLLARISTATGD
jgi:hypothetical protein